MKTRLHSIALALGVLGMTLAGVQKAGAQSVMIDSIHFVSGSQVQPSITTWFPPGDSTVSFTCLVSPHGNHAIIKYNEEIGPAYEGDMHFTPLVSGLDDASSYDLCIFFSDVNGTVVNAWEIMTTFSMATSSVATTEKKKLFTVFPNPATDNITIVGTTCDTYVVTDMMGKTLLKLQREGKETRIDCSALANGTYAINGVPFVVQK